MQGFGHRRPAASGASSPPGRADPVGVSIGGEYRQEQRLQRSRTPTPPAATWSASIRSTAVPGEFDVAEGFGEMAIPIITRHALRQGPVGSMCAYRFSSYDKAGDASTYRIGGQWQPDRRLQDPRFV